MAKSSSARIRGITIEISADNKEFINAFKKMDDEIRQTSTALKDIDRLLKVDPGNAELLTQKQQQLGTAIGEVKDRLVLEREELEKLKNADQTPEVVKQQETLQRQIEADEQQLKGLQNELKEFGSVGKQQALEVAQQFESVGDKISGVGEQISSAGRTMSRRVTAPIVAAGTDMVKTAADFDSGMAKVQAVSGATAEEIESLRDTALDMAGKTSFTASETSEALYYMGLAGWKSEQMISGLPAILNLAAASGEDLGITSDIVTDALTAFGLTAEDAEEFVDVLATASSNSNTTVAGMGEAFKYVAPVAGALGYNIKDVSLAMGVMANNGIKGSQAGTALRNILSRMSKPTSEVQEAMDKLGVSLTDSNGDMLSMGELLDSLRDAFGTAEMPMEEFNRQVASLDAQLEDGTLTQEEYEGSLERLAISAYGVEGAEKAKLAAMLGGQRSMAPILALVNTSAEDYNKLASAIDNSAGSAQKMADVMLDNLGGQVTILKSQIEGVAIELGEIMVPAISGIVEKIQGWVEAFKDLDTEQKEAILQIAGVVAAIGPALLVGGKVIEAIGSITSGIGGLIALIAGNPIGAAIAAVAIVLGTAYVAAQIYKDELGYLNDAEKELYHTAEDERQAYEELLEARRNNNSAINESYDALEGEWERLQAITDETGHVREGYEEEASYIVNHLNEALGTNIELKDDQILRYQTLKRSVEALIETKRAEAILSANEGAYIDALEKRKNLATELADAYDVQKDREAELNELIRQRNEMEKEYPNIAEDAKSANANASNAILNRYRGLNNQIERNQKAWEENQASIESLKDTYDAYGSTIANYEGLLQSVETGAEDLSEAVMLMSSDMLRAGAASEASLQNQYQTMTETFYKMRDAAKVQGSGITQDMVAEYARMAVLAAGELRKGGYMFNSAGELNAKEFLNSIAKQAPAARTASTTVSREAAAGVGSQKDAFGAQGRAAIATYDQGLLSKAADTRTAGSRVAGVGKSGAASVDYKPTGSNAASQYASGLSSGTNSSRTSGHNMAEGGKSGAGEVNFTSTGTTAAQQYANGMAGQEGYTRQQARKLPEGAQSELSGYSLYNSGYNFAQGFASGIEKASTNVTSSAQSMAKKAVKEVNKVLAINSPSKVLEEAGMWFDLGMAEGILGTSGEVDKAAATMAMSAAGSASLTGAAGLSAGGASTLQNPAVASSATYGDINITVNGAEGQDVNALADIIQDRLYRAVSRRQAVIA